MQIIVYLSNVKNIAEIRKALNKLVKKTHKTLDVIVSVFLVLYEQEIANLRRGEEEIIINVRELMSLSPVKLFMTTIVGLKSRLRHSAISSDHPASYIHA